MKMQVMGLKTFLQLVAVISVVGFCSIAQAQATTVNLKVNDSETKLIITSRGNCSSNNTNGCLKPNGKALFNFVLTEKNCSTGGKWNLSTVTLGMSEGSEGNLTAVAASDFNADQSTGVVTPDSSSKSHILIKDDNTEAYTVWYIVKATCNGVTIDTDPRVVNDGSGHT